ncbi:MAG: cysteine desulfurase-like protein [Janthinobacterium lividum]
MAEIYFDPAPLRAQFPSLALTLDAHPAVFFDNPGGTQVPETVISAVANYYRHSNANVGGAFETSRRTDAVVADARAAVADLLNAPGPETIVFGPSMTALTFHLARSFADALKVGDEIIVTTLDHDANIAPWVDLKAVGAVIRVVDIHLPDGTLDMDSLAAALSPLTRLVAVTHASNAVGTIPDVARITQMAHEHGALVFIDAVQYAPHGPIDVQALGCDFLACSPYKFFGPHQGILYSKAEHLRRLTPHKVKPSKDTLPYRWEMGTLSHEGLAGVSAAVAYLESVGVLYGLPFLEEYQGQGYTGRALTLKTAMRAISAYEQTLSRHLLTGLQSIPDIQIYGLTDLARLDERLPTVAFTWPRLSPRETAEMLASFGICVWSGNYYALRLMEALGLEGQGGAVRVGLTHYNTAEEIDRMIAALRGVPSSTD